MPGGPTRQADSARGGTAASGRGLSPLQADKQRASEDFQRALNERFAARRDPDLPNDGGSHASAYDGSSNGSSNGSNNRSGNHSSNGAGTGSHSRLAHASGGAPHDSIAARLGFGGQRPTEHPALSNASQGSGKTSELPRPGAGHDMPNLAGKDARPYGKDAVKEPGSRDGLKDAAKESGKDSAKDSKSAVSTRTGDTDDDAGEVRADSATGLPGRIGGAARRGGRGASSEGGEDSDGGDLGGSAALDAAAQQILINSTPTPQIASGAAPQVAASARGKLPEEATATRAALETALLTPSLPADSAAANTWQISVSQPLGASLDLHASRAPQLPGDPGKAAWTLGIRSAGRDAAALAHDLPRLSERLRARQLKTHLHIESDGETADGHA